MRKDTNTDRAFMVVLTVFLAAATLLFLVSLGYLTLEIRANHAAPYCPTEDSCAPEYDGERDEWEIREVTP